MPVHALTDSLNGDVTVAIYKRKIILTDAQIKAWPTIPVQLVEAPGENKITLFHLATFNKVALTTPYVGAVDGCGIAICYEGGLQASYGFYNDAAASLADFSALITNATGRGGSFIAVDAASRQTPDLTNGYFPCTIISMDGLVGVNKALVLQANGVMTENLTGGDSSNTIEVTVFYSIIEL